MTKQKQIEIYPDDDFFDLVPRPTKEQRQALKESIQKEGLHTPIIIDSKGMIIDGYTRWEICQELGFEPEYIIKTFDSDQAKRNFAITTNLKRRQLNDFQIYELFEKQIIEMQQRKKIKSYQTQKNSNLGKIPKLTQKESNANTILNDIEKLTGVSHSTAHQIRYIKKHGNELQIQQARNGIYGIHRIKRTLTNTGRKKIVGAVNGGYRSNLNITFEILNYIKNNPECRVTHIRNACGVSDMSIKPRMITFLGKNYVEKTTKKKKLKKYTGMSEYNTYSLTSKGIELENLITNLFDTLPISLGGLQEDESYTNIEVVA